MGSVVMATVIFVDVIESRSISVEDLCVCTEEGGRGRESGWGGVGYVILSLRGWSDV